MQTPSPDFDQAAWRTSSFSDGNAQCVEVAFKPGWVGVRDSKRRGSGSTLVFRTAEWGAFIAGVRAGEFRSS